MTTVNTTRTWLVSFGVGNNENADAIIEQGIDDINQLGTIDPTDVDVICTAARKPGGTILIGNRQAGHVPNPGRPIPALFQQRLKLAVLAARHYNTVGRPIDPSILTWERVQHFRHLDEINNNWKEPEPLPPLSRSIPITKMIELIHQQLRKMMGVRKIPLFYVVCRDATPGPIANFPLRTDPSAIPCGDRFTSFHDELIERASHDHPSFYEDNALVLDVLMQTLQTTTHVGTLKSFERTRNGRGALKALEAFNNGKSKWDTIVGEAERVMFTNKFDGKNDRYTLYRHIANHRDAFNDMVSASSAENYTYQVPTEHTRVQRFLHSLVTSDPRIVSGKSFIIGNPNMLNSFAEATEYLLQIAPKVKVTPHRETQTISAVT